MCYFRPNVQVQTSFHWSYKIFNEKFRSNFKMVIQQARFVKIHLFKLIFGWKPLIFQNVSYVKARNTGSIDICPGKSIALIATVHYFFWVVELRCTIIVRYILEFTASIWKMLIFFQQVFLISTLPRGSTVNSEVAQYILR